MSVEKKAALREPELNEPSRKFLAELRVAHGSYLDNLLMEPAADGSWNLFVEIPSPTGDQRRTVSLWLEEELIPTLAFGAWHTHANLWSQDKKRAVQRMLRGMDRILAGQVALIEEPGIDLRFPYIVINLDSDADLLDELTNPDAPPHITLLSWPGSSDRIVSIDELGHGGLSSQRDNSIWGSAM